MYTFLNKKRRVTKQMLYVCTPVFCQGLAHACPTCGPGRVVDAGATGVVGTTGELSGIGNAGRGLFTQTVPKQIKADDGPTEMVGTGLGSMHTTGTVAVGDTYQFIIGGTSTDFDCSQLYLSLQIGDVEGEVVSGIQPELTDSWRFDVIIAFRGADVFVQISITWGAKTTDVSGVSYPLKYIGAKHQQLKIICYVIDMEPEHKGAITTEYAVLSRLY